MPEVAFQKLPFDAPITAFMSGQRDPYVDSAERATIATGTRDDRRGWPQFKSANPSLAGDWRKSPRFRGRARRACRGDVANSAGLVDLFQ